MRSCAGAGGGKEGGERVTRRPPPPTRGKLRAPLPAPPARALPEEFPAPRTAGKLSENSARQAGRTGPAPRSRPETGPASPAALAVGPAASAGPGAPGKRPLRAGSSPHPGLPRPGTLPGVTAGLLAGEGSCRPEELYPDPFTPVGGPYLPLPGRRGGEAPRGRRQVPAALAQRGSQPWDAMPCEPPRAQVLTWRKAWRESFRRTATAAMATAPGARGRRRGTAEAWRRRGEDEELPSFPLSLLSDLFASVPVPPPRAARSPRTV